MTAYSRRVGVSFLCLAILAIALMMPAIAAEQASENTAPDADRELDTDQVELTALLHYFLKNSATEEAHARFWANDLVYTSSNGTRFGKADIMQGFGDMEESDNVAEASDAPEVVFTGEDVKVQVFGTTAVITFRLVGTPDDASEPMQYFNSGTFLKRQGRWQAVNWQATIIPQEAP